MGEILGVLAAVASSTLGGTSIGATRFLVNVLDPTAIGSFRFGLGFVFLLPAAFAKREPWPTRQDLIGVIGLGLLFFFCSRYSSMHRSSSPRRRAGRSPCLPFHC